MADVTLPSFTGETCDWFDAPCHISSAIDWFAAFAQWLPMKVFEGFMSACASIIEALPALPAAAQAQTALSALSGAGYVAGLVSLQSGAAVVIASLLARFLLRRIPFIG